MKSKAQKISIKLNQKSLKVLNRCLDTDGNNVGWHTEKHDNGVGWMTEKGQSVGWYTSSEK